MGERLVLTALLFLAGYVAYCAYCRWQMKQVHTGKDPIRAEFKRGVPTVVYFTTPNCMPCKTRQQPTLKRLVELHGVHVVQIDATQRPELADQWGVLSAPTTFVFDSLGAPQAVNHGVAEEELLKKQLRIA